MNVIVQLAVGKSVVKVACRILLVLVSVFPVCSYEYGQSGIWFRGKRAVAKLGEVAECLSSVSG